MLRAHSQSHAGTVRFGEFGEENTGELEVEWTVDVRPLPGCAGFVPALTTSAVSKQLQNLKQRLEEGT